jgi:hypothetical protein
VIHRQLGILEHLLGAVRLAVAERKPDRGGQENLAVVERDRRAERAADGLREGDEPGRVALRQQDHGELIAGETRQRVLRLQQPAKAACQRQQDRVADRDADGIVDLLETVEVDHHHGSADVRIGLGEGQHGFQPVDESCRFGRPVRLSCTASCRRRSSAVLIR